MYIYFSIFVFFQVLKQTKVAIMKIFNQQSLAILASISFQFKLKKYDFGWPMNNLYFVIHIWSRSFYFIFCLFLIIKLMINSDVIIFNKNQINNYLFFYNFIIKLIVLPAYIAFPFLSSQMNIGFNKCKSTVEKVQIFYQMNPQMLIPQLQNPLPSFQHRVSSCMINLGGMDLAQYMKTIQKPFNQETSVLGDQIYNSRIRPICVYKKYLWDSVVDISDTKDINICRFEQWIDRNIVQAEEESDEGQQKKKKKQKSCLAIYESSLQRNKKMVCDEQIKDKKVKVNHKKGSKADQQNSKQKKQILKQNACNINFFSKLDFLFENFHPKYLRTQMGFSSNILQIKLITFFYIRNFIDFNYKKQGILLQQVYECIHVLKKTLLLIEQYVGPTHNLLNPAQKEGKLIPVSKTLISDLKLTFFYLVKKFKYNNQKILFNFPRLAYDNCFYKFFGAFDIKAYPSQIQLIKYISESLNKEKFMIGPQLIGYNTMVGSGKTSIIIALATLIKRINYEKLAKNKNKRAKLVFCCQIASVRAQVARFLYKNKIQFQIAYRKTIKRREQFIFPLFEKYGDIKTYPEQIDVIISDFETTYHILDNHDYSAQQTQVFNSEIMNWKNPEKYVIAKLKKEDTILFVDEPSYACNSGKPQQTLKLLTILKNRAPQITVLSSATFPLIKSLPNFTRLVEIQHPNLKIKQIQSKQFQIGCQFCTFKGEVLYPHTGVTNKQQLRCVLRKTEQNPFIMRLYTGVGLLSLIQQCRKYNIDLDENVDFSSYKTTVTYKNFPQITKYILTRILQEDDKIIQQVCQLSQDQLCIYRQDEDDEDIFQKQDLRHLKKSKRGIDFQRIITIDAYKFLGGCLIATKDPISFAVEKFRFWTDDIPSIHRLRQRYKQNEQSKYHAMLQILGNLESDQIIKKPKKTKDGYSISIPAKKVINSVAHYEYYCRQLNNISKHEQKVYKSKVVNSFSFQQILDYFQGVLIDDQILKLLLCGIGLYAEQGLPPEYLAKVEQMASMSQLAFIICDKSLSNGVNFPISNVILLDDLAYGLELNEIFQLVGRAGRVGRSWTARAYIQNQTSQKLFKYIHGHITKTGKEIQVLEALAQYCLANPQLKLRTPNSQVTVAEQAGIENSKQIVIKIKNNQDSLLTKHEIKKISLVLKKQNKIYCCAIPFKGQLDSTNFINLNYYKVPSSPIIYDDLPHKSQHQLQIQDYYRNEENYISQTIANAARRIGKMCCEFEVEGHFDQLFCFRNYQQYFCSSTSTYVVIVDCSNQPNPCKFDSLNYNLHAITVPDKSNQFERLLLYQDLQLLQQLQIACEEAWKKLRQNPVSLLLSDIKTIKIIMQKINSQRQFVFFIDLFNGFQGHVDKIYGNITRNVDNKDSLLYEAESKIVIFIQMCLKVEQFEEPLFCIDENVRSIAKVKEIIDKIGQKVKLQIGEQSDNMEQEIMQPSPVDIKSKQTY